jgi:hypothetical protein
VSPAIEIPRGHTRETTLRCLDREIAMREANYPRWVTEGRMRQSKALDELAAMKAVRDVISQLPEAQPRLPGLPGVR